MKYIKFLAFSFLLFAVSCSPYRYIYKHLNEVRNRICIDSTQQNVVVTKHDSVFIQDTLIYSKTDSASLRLYFSCDSNNQVLLQQIRTLNGRKLTINSNYHNGTLTVDCSGTIAELNRQLKYWQTNLRTVETIKTVRINIPDNAPWHHKVPWWAWMGLTVIIALAFFVGYRARSFITWITTIV